MEFVLHRRRVLFDEAVPFTIEDVSPGAKVEVSVEFTFAGSVLRSAATFVSDDNGVIDPTAAAPVAGSYACVDGRGLYWSADPDEGWQWS